MTKYKLYFIKMLEENRPVFEKFKKLHDEYSLKPTLFQEKFNKEGEKILEIIREYERRLCANTERGMYSRFSGKLAEKFQNEVRKFFPMIDNIGLIVKKKKPAKQEVFTVKKINLKI